MLFWISVGVNEIWICLYFQKLIRITIKWKLMGKYLKNKNNIKQEDIKGGFHWFSGQAEFSNQIQAHDHLGHYSCFSRFLFHFHFTDCDTTGIKAITCKFFFTFWRNFQALNRPDMAVQKNCSLPLCGPGTVTAAVKKRKNSK